MVFDLGAKVIVVEQCWAESGGCGRRRLVEPLRCNKFPDHRSIRSGARPAPWRPAVGHFWTPSLATTSSSRTWRTPPAMSKINTPPTPRTCRPRTRHHQERGHHRPLPHRIRERHNGRRNVLAAPPETSHQTHRTTHPPRRTRAAGERGQRPRHARYHRPGDAPAPTPAAWKPSAASCRPSSTG